jgi:predicted metalloprotease with PDZ domain
LAILLLWFACASNNLRKPAFDGSDFDYFYDYELDLTDRSDDQFHVTLRMSSLGRDNDTFNFVKTVPGSYSIHDIGRFVSSFEAFDSSGSPVATEKVSVNQFRFSEPERVARVVYSVSDTWDAKVDTNEVARMSGSSIMGSNVLLNPSSVFGYVKGKREAPIRLRLSFPDKWQVGTSLSRRDGDYFSVENFSELVESPMLLGELSNAGFNVDGIDVQIFVHSKTGVMKAGSLKGPIEKIFKGVIDFMGRKPTDHYTFLFHFDDRHAGAHEHGNNSVYVYREAQFDKLKPILFGPIAHELYHLQTPLHIGETMPDKFDYETTTPTEHLWFYEGVTEWAADLILLRYGLIKPSEYFFILGAKVRQLQDFKSGRSLTQLSLNSYNDPEEVKYIYPRGALAAFLLDIEILDATNGKQGLRDVVGALAKKYSPANPIVAENFFEDLGSEGPPSARGFIDKHIKAHSDLPLDRYAEKLGLEYEPELYDTQGRNSLGYLVYEDDATHKLIIKDPDQRALSMGFQESDTLLQINNIKLYGGALEDQLGMLKLGEKDTRISYTALVKRGTGEELISAKTVQLKWQYVFRPTTDVSQHRLYKIWMDGYKEQGE